LSWPHKGCFYSNAVISRVVTCSVANHVANVGVAGN